MWRFHVRRSWWRLRQTFPHTKLRFTVKTVLIITAVEYWKQNCHVRVTPNVNVLWVDPSCVSRCSVVKYLSWYIRIVYFPPNRRLVNFVLTDVALSYCFCCHWQWTVRACTCAASWSWTFHKVRNKVRMFVCMHACITFNEILKWKYAYVYVITDWDRLDPPGIWEADAVWFVLFSSTIFHLM